MGLKAWDFFIYYYPEVKMEQGRGAEYSLHML